MGQDSDAVWRAGTVALLGCLPGCRSVRDVGGIGSPVRHDVDLWLDDDRRVAVEVTRVLDDAVVETYAALDKHGTQWPWDGVASWTVFTTGINVTARRLRRELPTVLNAFESIGIEKVDGGTWTLEPRGILHGFDEVEALFRDLDDLGVRVIERKAPRGRTVVRVWKPTITGFPADPQDVTARLLQAVERKVEQLRAAQHVDERWVVLWVDLTELSITMALESRSWEAVAPNLLLPDEVDRALVVVPRFGDAPHFLVHSCTRVGWLTERVEQGPVHAAMATFSDHTRSDDE